MIQGFGRVGTILARRLERAGVRVVGIADDDTGVVNAAGIRVSDAVAWMREHDRIAGVARHRADRPGGGLRPPVRDPRPRGTPVTARRATADAVQARIVAEVAGGAVTPEADVALADRGIPVIPDILSSAGGLVVGYFEWVQDMQAFFWNDAQGRAELERVMDGAVAASSARRLTGSM